MKKIIILAFAVFMALTTEAKSVVLTLSDGTLVYYLINNKKSPVMKFDDGKCVMETDTYEFSGIKNFYISETDDPSAIASLKTTKRFTRNGNTFVVESNAKGIHVYDTNGKQTNAEVAVNNGYATIDLSNVPTGTYIIKVGDSALKVLKK